MSKSRDLKTLLRQGTNPDRVKYLPQTVAAPAAITVAPKLSKAETIIKSPKNEELFGEDFVENVTVYAGVKGRKGKVKLADLHIDDSYQYRPETEPGRIADLEKWTAERGGFDPLEAGSIHVNRRANGRLFVVDGGGRVWMALRAGLEYIDAIVYEGLDWAQEKKLFIAKNNNKRTIRAPHLFAVAASSGLEPHATIMSLLDETKYGIERKKGDGQRALFAATALLHVFYLDGTGEILQLALHDLRKTVGDQRGVDGRLLVTVGMLRFCGAGRDQTRLRDVLTHDPQERGNPVVSLDTTFGEARALTVGVITSRTVQSRDLNPFLFKVLAARFNYKLPQEGGFRLALADVGRAKKAFADPDVVARWGEKTLYKDTWSWKFCQ